MSGHAPEIPLPLPGRSRSFPTTHWSLVCDARADPASRARAALEELCQRYWYPLYIFIRRQGRAHHEAEDCTQQFLAQLLAADGIGRARREQGRFRSFLLTGLRNFLINEWQSTQAEKRGGGQAPIPLEAQGADQRFALEPADSALSPDQAFDRTWAHGMIAASVELLRIEYENSGRGALFTTLAPLVWGNVSSESLTGHAGRLGLKEQAFTVALHRLRRRIGERLRGMVAETVADETDINTELRHLIAAAGTSEAGS